MTSFPGVDLDRVRAAMAEDDIDGMWTELDAAATAYGLSSWREIQVPARNKFAGLLWEAADAAASRCFVALTERLYENSFWCKLGDADRAKRSAAFVMPLSSLHERLLEKGAVESVARDRLADAFIAFFAKDDDAEQAITAFKVKLPIAVGEARSEALARFQQAALEALISKPVRSAGRKGL